MYIELDLTETHPEPRLCEPRDFQHLNVSILGSGGAVSASAALAPVGELLDPQTTRLRVAAIRQLAGFLGADEGWSRQFEAMLDYALSKGWLDTSREVVEAHCEWAPPDSRRKSGQTLYDGHTMSETDRSSARLLSEGTSSDEASAGG